MFENLIRWLEKEAKKQEELSQRLEKIRKERERIRLEKEQRQREELRRQREEELRRYEDAWQRKYNELMEEEQNEFQERRIQIHLWAYDRVLTEEEAIKGMELLYRAERDAEKSRNDAAAQRRLASPTASTSKSNIHDCYQDFLQLPDDTVELDLYLLIGVERFCDDPRVIKTALLDRNQVLLQSQNADHYPEVKRLLRLLGQASLTLTNPKLKANYDSELKKSLSRD